jgi:SPP1 family predicted phage head-tail adaptor
MQAGKLRHRLVIESNSPTKNSLNETVDSWSTFATVWSAIEPLAGNERFLTQLSGDYSELTTRIRIRYRDGINNGMRATHRGNIYDIEAVINRYIEDKEIWLLCKQTGIILGTEGEVDGNC